MKTRFLLLSALLMLSGLYMAQRYNAGVGSGGNYVVFVGPYAGRITTSTYNSFVGYQAGYNNSTGSSNSFMGANAGYNNTSGNFNLSG